MYEMRAESTADRLRLVWHVLAKETPSSALCGFLLRPERAAPSATEPGAEHYCTPCMDAFSRIIELPGTST
ncbi:MULTISPECIES: hypothetical protein [unclassified Streptomyces]|uniref:hypothetical protein n=1 Tax=unclassified Streptomyces TaxID=2593676 RepID=UPI001BECF111|nr:MULTISPECIES: hypothetical protein [unclassified Streptomyces]MBT2408522.1 hypothetical protein [Streptomyces sp. ISL-21]MBT2459689.1 hypothetical protein [Streptomyces sp. ISL-86]MBT2611959.1 hypothetical protein [Streptomyces sp. ISL-87]